MFLILKFEAAAESKQNVGTLLNSIIIACLAGKTKGKPITN